ncbi:uncharacterized protein LOC110235034 [Exaiptasia diaphana]|uniref:YqaJ viral recombinase domain-containing protein n=1 Tax=Exaiptasia diaphana TaxID=2652724 RepID=A0A913WYI2_EXADI|nr:uncharacterized protein LOC110235034 [Exaiptasia diaphana]
MTKFGTKNGGNSFRESQGEVGMTISEVSKLFENHENVERIVGEMQKNVLMENEEEQDSDFQVVINCSEERAIRHPTTPIDTPGYPLMGIEFEKCTSVPIDTSEKCVNYSTLLHVTYQESNQLQCETQKQSECPKWYALKYPRLTASKFGDICKKMEISRAKPKLLADKLLQQNPPTTFVDRMLKWGRENEDVAVQVYRGLGDYKMVKIFPCGFYISPEDSFLGATPDRVVYDPLARHPWGILEVKCPYSVKKKTAIQAAKEVKTFMCREENGLLFLKESDPYYYQVQGQMGITGAKWCDFIVYTTQGISVQRIEYDSDFWKAEAKKLGEFYFSHFLPKYIMLQVSV